MEQHGECQCHEFLISQNITKFLYFFLKLTCKCRIQTIDVVYFYERFIHVKFYDFAIHFYTKLSHKKTNALEKSIIVN